MKYLPAILAAFVTTATYASELELVQKYVRLDFVGARLSSDTYGEISSLSAWEDEPGWDLAVITSKVSVRKHARGIEVTYTEHGSCPGKDPHTKVKNTVVFSFENKGGKLLIAGPLIRPRVSVGILCQRHKECCLNNSDEKKVSE